MAMSMKVWKRKAYVSISALNGSEVALQSKTTSLGWSGGFSDVEGIDVFSGKITSLGSAEDIEVTLDGIPVSHADFDWIAAGQTASTAFGTGGATITTSTDERKYRVVFLWTDQTGVTGATQAITSSYEAYRRGWADCYLTSLEGSHDAGDNLTCNMTFKTTEEDEDGRNNWGIWAKDTTTGTLSALNAFTSSTTKW
jgi:hypothetical protein